MTALLLTAAHKIHIVVRPRPSFVCASPRSTGATRDLGSTEGAHARSTDVASAARRVSSSATTLPDPRSSILEGKRLAHDGTVRDDPALIERARVLFVSATAAPPFAALAHYHAAYAGYRLARLPRDADGHADPTGHVATAITHLHSALEANPQDAEALALLAVCYGMRAGKRIHHTARDGPAIGRAMGQARGLAPGNPRIWMLHAASLANRPALLGGSTTEARQSYEMALALFPVWTVPTELHPDWGWAEAHAMLGLARLKENDAPAARVAFEHALAIAPDYALVKHEWLPQAIQAT